METMEIMEQLARKEPKVRKETKEIWDQEESVATMGPKARRVTLGFPQNYRYNTSGSYWLQQISDYGFLHCKTAPYYCKILKKQILL